MAASLRAPARRIQQWSDQPGRSAFAPALHPTLETRVAAMLVASRTSLAT